MSALYECTAVQGAQIATSKATEIALSTLGITLDGSKTSQAPRFVQIRMEGADDMNAKEDEEGLSAILRLKEQNSFLVASYTAFGLSDKGKQTIGNDLIEVKELVLVLGQTLNLKEKLFCLCCQ